MGIERGLDTRTSAAAYFHSLMIENVRYNYGEVALRRSIGPTLLEVGGSYADTSRGGGGGFAARASWLAAFGETYVRADAMRGRRPAFPVGRVAVAERDLTAGGRLGR